MSYRKPIQLCGEFSLKSTDAEWVRSMRDAGDSRDAMVAAWQRQTGGSPESAAIRVDYYLGNIGPEAILEHLTPKEPQSLELHGRNSRGYQLKAHGPDAEFDVLLLTPFLSEQEVQALLDNHQPELCWLAYKNTHEGNRRAPHQLDSGDIATPILESDIQHLLA